MWALPLSLMVGQDVNSWRKDGKPVTDTANMKSKNGFAAELFLTESAQFFEDWRKPETPKLTTLKKDKARRNVPIFTAILFADPGIDANGAADVTCDIVIRRPDGTVYGEQKDVVGWKASIWLLRTTSNSPRDAWASGLSRKTPAAFTPSKLLFATT